MEDLVYDLVLRGDPAVALLHGTSRIERKGQTLAWRIEKHTDIRLEVNPAQLSEINAKRLGQAVRDLIAFLSGQLSSPYPIHLQEFRREWEYLAPYQQQMLRERLARRMQRNRPRDTPEDLWEELPGWKAWLPNIRDKPPIPWQEVLRRFVRTHGGNHRRSTNHRTSRRYGTTPGLRNSSPDRIGLAIDTSGSIPPDLLGIFFSEANRLYRYLGFFPLVEFDHRIQRAYRFRPGMPIPAMSNGGTRFDPPLQWAARQHLRALVILTDGQAAAPESFPAGLDLLWLVYGTPPKWMQQKPAGRLLLL